ncbi:hypothetical protein K505DRAFT_321962 [Melanomma pulvis-pyrius CBS 109.77]|uniref:Uncharacterized protein n=1 Tax=Melanomma pulvis-pyrius CBS 109.77 TaxID=1314802 RepID=A0A6A6XPP4_9PLEO|nr:hypothetical protein K505DRAFT_321962 [Melanomma pulvis-pyrius CBS 109.77]
MTTDTPPDTHHLSTSQAPAATPMATETLSPLEQEILDEYARLLDNLNNVRPRASPPNSHPPPQKAQS